MEVVPDNENISIWTWSSQEEVSCSYFPGCRGTKRVLPESKPSGREGSFVDQYGSVEQLVSVIDVAEKTIELRNFRNAQVLLMLWLVI